MIQIDRLIYMMDFQLDHLLAERNMFLNRYFDKLPQVKREEVDQEIAAIKAEIDRRKS